MLWQMPSSGYQRYLLSCFVFSLGLTLFCPLSPTTLSSNCLSFLPPSLKFVVFFCTGAVGGAAGGVSLPLECWDAVEQGWMELVRCIFPTADRCCQGMNTGSQEPPQESHLATFVSAAIHGIPLTGQLHSFGYQ